MLSKYCVIECHACVLDSPVSSVLDSPVSSVLDSPVSRRRIPGDYTSSPISMHVLCGAGQHPGHEVEAGINAASV